MKKLNKNKVSRRSFIKTAATGTIASAIVAGFPDIIPATVLGSNSPGNRINIGAMATAAFSRVHDLPGIWRYDNARIMAVCDLDSNRVNRR